MNGAHDGSGSGGKSQPSSGTSKSLLAKVQARDPAAWERLVQLYAPLVFHWCRAWRLQEQDTADIFQDVFHAVARHIGTFHKDKEGDTFRGWLRIVTMNKVRDHLRRLGHEPGGVGGTDAQRRLSELPAPMPADEPSVERKAEYGLFYRAIDFIRGEFEDRTWQAFWRTTVEGRVPKDVGAELGMSPGAVRVAKSRVLRRLREELGDLAD